MIDFPGVLPALNQALSKRGYAELTPVQKAVLAPEMEGADALVSAQTGSGKTVAFGLALAPTLLAGAETFARAGAPLALVIAPTRELALQVKRELEWLYERTGAVVASCVGGMDMRGERNALERGAHIVVGTPGRLCDHIRRNALDISTLRAVVLDEADEMLDLGFREDLEFILKAAPAERRTLMFSATVSRPISHLAKNYQRDAVRITTADEQKQHLDIEYRAMLVASHDKENAIVNVLRYFEAQTALVFCSTRAAVNHMTARFNNRGFAVVALSGELSQNERTHALQAMRDGRARVCIATDVAARGIDLPKLELVIHADLPTDREGLLHRSGRTGRAGRKGVSVLIVPHHARRRVERLLLDASIEASWGRPPSADEVLQRDKERLLADPDLSEPLTDEERSFAEELIARQGAEQVAAAFIRRYRAAHSAPEDLQAVAVHEPSAAGIKRPRTDHGDSVWFTMSVGRKQNAEPRWLLPMLCGAGRITKRDIGSIKIQNEETFFQLTPGAVDRFLASIGPSGVLEKNIKVRRLDGAPEMSKDTPRYADRKPYQAEMSPAPGGTGTERKRKFARAATAAPAERSLSKPNDGKPKDAKFGQPKHAKLRRDNPPQKQSN
jgi:ATP-dependent RNA helicase DeaD